MIKAIETHYKGCRFRSRLEARWAVFFDALGIEWQYEPEGYNINGIMYLPDFWLPYIECFAEVKPAGLSEDEIDKVNALALESGKKCILLVGVPENTKYLVAEPHSTLKEFGTLDSLNAMMTDPDNYIITNSDKTRCLFYSEGGMLLLRQAAGKDNRRDGGAIGIAVSAAKSARFEHGETP